jgi:hypothetical protein
MKMTDHQSRLETLVVGVLADAEYPSRAAKREAEKALADAIQRAIDEWCDANVVG